MDYHKILTKNMGNAVQVHGRTEEGSGYKGYGDLKELDVNEDGSFTLLLVHEHQQYITNFNPKQDTIRIYTQSHANRMDEFHLELADMGITSHDMQRQK